VLTELLGQTRDVVELTVPSAGTPAEQAPSLWDSLASGKGRRLWAEAKSFIAKLGKAIVSDRPVPLYPVPPTMLFHADALAGPITNGLLSSYLHIRENPHAPKNRHFRIDSDLMCTLDQCAHDQLGPNYSRGCVACGSHAAPTWCVGVSSTTTPSTRCSDDRGNPTRRHPACHNPCHGTATVCSPSKLYYKRKLVSGFSYKGLVYDRRYRSYSSTCED
jgi:hypothetical protein